MLSTPTVLSSGEELFCAFVEPCIEWRHTESVISVMRGGTETFSEATFERYLGYARGEGTPTRATLMQDFPVPYRELLAFARSLGISDDDEVWSYDIVALFWRTVHHKDDPDCCVIAARVVTLLSHHDVVFVAEEGKPVFPVVNILHFPLTVGDIVSVHKLVICEKRPRPHAT